MRALLIVVALFAFVPTTWSQEKVETTNSFAITGEVKVQAKVSGADLKKFKTYDIGDVVITNHLGEKRSEAKGLKGVLLRDVLATVEISASSPKVLSEYYFVCKATDGYTVVYSWNEIFNTVVGDTSYIVTEKNGKSLELMEDSILLISPKDMRTGRRHVKSLVSITVKHAQ